jgi:AcrR family transcriptional regulator
LFIRKGFDDTSVDEISEMAGYSRGAFYSNFDDKGQLFLAVIDRHRPNSLDVLDEISHGQSDPVERMAAVREWFSNQWRLEDFIELQMEFSRRAMRDRNMREHLAELCRRKVEILAASVFRHRCATEEQPPDRPQIIGLVLLAVAQGLGTLALHTGPEWEDMYQEAALLAFDRIAAPQISQIGQLQC